METNIWLERDSQQRQPSCSVNVNHVPLCPFGPQQLSAGLSARRKMTVAPTVHIKTTLVDASAAQPSCVISDVDTCDR